MPTVSSEKRNEEPPYRSVPLSNYWERLTSSSSQQLGWRRVQLDRDQQHQSLQRTFQNSIKAAEEFLKSPTHVGTPRLGITPPTVSSTGSKLRYFSYRTTSRSSPNNLDDESKPDRQRLDPVILSYEQSEEVVSDSEDDEDEEEDVEQLGQSPLGNMHESFESSAVDTPLKHPKETSPVATAMLRCVSPDNDSSAATEPTSNTSPAIQVFTPRVDKKEYNEEEDSDASSDFSPQGPGKMYLQVLRKSQPRQSRVPTPPRRSDATLPTRMLDDEDSESEVSATLDIPLKVTETETKCLSEDLERSDDNQDKSIELDTAEEVDETPLRNGKRCALLLFGLAVLCVVSLVLVLFLVPSDWQARFASDAEGSNSALNSSDSPTASPVVNASAITSPVPTIQNKPAPTVAPTWDPLHAARLNEAFQIFSFWGRFDLWSNLDTPQSKALYWLINNADWEQYSNYRKIQRYAMAVLYFATQDDSSLWTHSTGWLTNEDECSWFTSTLSVPCSVSGQGDGELRVLHLEQNGLKGLLPAEVALLTQLEEVRLVGNGLTGFVPQEWTVLSNLRVLELRDNKLNDRFSIAGLSTWSELEYLDLSENNLWGELPDAIAEMSKLNSLMLGYNQFSGLLPESWSSLGNLRVLSLEANEISGGIPSAYVEGLLELRELRLASNFLDDWSTSSWEFPLLETLDLGSNELGLDGTIPESFYSMQSLRVLSLSDNGISQVLSNIIGLLWRLEYLDLSANAFWGEIPDAFGDLRELRTLQLQRNAFSGELPRSMRRLRNIQHLRLDDNVLETIENVCRGIEDTLIEFYADCAAGSGLSCPCCTHCCDVDHVCFDV